MPQVTPSDRYFRHPRRILISPYNAGVRSEAWLQVAGFVTWLGSGIPMLAAIARGDVAAPVAAAWGCAFIAFGVAFGVVCRGAGPLTRRALVGLQAAAGLVMVQLTRDGLAAATLVVVAAQLLEVFTTRGAILWLAGQTVLLATSFWTKFGLVPAITLAGTFAGFQIFALATSSLAHRERAARLELARTNADLVAARSLLAEDSRVAERLRISRDLHDTIGHHLTALSLQLEVASRLSSGQAAAHVDQAHAVTRLLLSDVRDVVSRLRETSRVNLAESIRALAAAAPSLAIHLDLPDPLELEDPTQAQAIIRCLQEIVTNTTRHAGANHLWISIELRADGIHLHARDDGRGAVEVRLGNGLSGMRERFEEHGGRVEFASDAGRGFEVHGFIPRHSGTTS